MNNLVYTVAYDLPGERTSRIMAKLLCCSLFRSLWNGSVFVFHNSPHLILPVSRPKLTEIYIDDSEYVDDAADKDADPAKVALHRALRARFELAARIENPEQYDWIIYLDADCLVFRDIEHLLRDDADIIVQPESGRSLLKEAAFNGYLNDGDPKDIPSSNSWLGRDGINAGTFAIRGALFHQFVADWRRIFESPPDRHVRFRDQTSFNKLLLNTDLRVKPFEKGEIVFPFHLNPNFLDYRHGAVLHFVGGKQNDKIGLAFALYMMMSFGEERGIFLDLIET